ncbi:hypothetical protein VP01_2755g1 [Puccinia sorghi]|uniref:Uncharacterized protein n=1 Tax=Puccinia sorghi TaxID=27349 RepID=A0A0L6V4S5_9BASI|nr:hypothetical protein VP01_2755g1 [Puccinia sorghi]
MLVDRRNFFQPILPDDVIGTSKEWRHSKAGIYLNSSSYVINLLGLQIERIIQPTSENLTSLNKFTEGWSLSTCFELFRQVLLKKCRSSSAISILADHEKNMGFFLLKCELSKLEEELISLQKKNLLNCLQLTSRNSQEASLWCTVTVPKHLHMQTSGVWMTAWLEHAACQLQAVEQTYVPNLVRITSNWEERAFCSLCRSFLNKTTLNPYFQLQLQQILATLELDRSTLIVVWLLTNQKCMYILLVRSQKISETQVSKWLYMKKELLSKNVHVPIQLLFIVFYLWGRFLALPGKCHKSSENNLLYVLMHWSIHVSSHNFEMMNETRFIIFKLKNYGKWKF